ncbi:MAG: hypothetical protein Q4A70_03350 [Candidatus Saccharibacteria bacterium]|nr:hypothetical protein [Candidatus Saccharibacteria bacterium]
MQLDIDGAGSRTDGFASLEIWEVGQFFCFAKEQRQASPRKKKLEVGRMVLLCKTIACLPHSKYLE